VSRRDSPQVVIATVTFNDNQLRSHLLPLLGVHGIGEVVLVTDVPPSCPLPRVKVVVPPTALRLVAGRAAAKAIMCATTAVRARPAWVIGFNIMPHGLNAFMAGRLAGAGVVYCQIGGSREWLGGGWDSDNAVLGRLRRPSSIVQRCLLSTIRRCDVVISMGSRGRNELIAHGVAEERIAIVPGAVDTQALDGAPLGEAYDVIAVGELISTKRFHDLIDAVALLHRDGTPVRTAIAGRGPLGRELRLRAASRGVGELVEFLGFRSDVFSLLKGARVFVSTSGYEGLSIAILEAMAAGVATVASDVGEIRDVVTDGVSGCLYAAGDVDGLAGALRGLLDGEERRREVARHGRTAAREYASVASVASRLTEALADGAGRR
jgi:glycosyltransferase involved in cell wall biosynthesis